LATIIFEQADTCGSPVLKAVGDAIDDLLAYVGQRKEKEEEAGEKDNAERGLPWNAASNDDGISEVRVEGHARSKGDRVICPDTHDERGNRSRNAGGEENALDRHACFGEDSRIDDDHIGHRHERRQAAKKLPADGGVVFVEVKQPLEQAGFPLGKSRQI
jgi:hypothetical protein